MSRLKVDLILEDPDLQYMDTERVRCIIGWALADHFNSVAVMIGTATNQKEIEIGKEH